MKMKKIVIMIIGLLSSLGLTGQVRVNNFEVGQDGSRINLSFDALVDKNATKKDYKLVMIPVVYNGNQSATLSPIVVETRQTRILDARNGLEPLPGAFLTENGKTVRYAVSMDYVDWIPGSDMRFDFLSVGCCSADNLTPLVAVRDIGATKVATPAPVPLVAIPAPVPAPVVAPPPAPPADAGVRLGGGVFILTKNASLLTVSGAVPARAVRSHLEVNFAQGSSKLNPYAFNNYYALREVVAILYSSRDALAGRKIEITGYASPEGTLMGNYTLAQNRAIAARNYILDNVPWLRPSDFEIVNGGENWEELYKLVERSNMPGRWQVLDIIENTPFYNAYNVERPLYYTAELRKKVLTELDGGRVWSYMLSNFFPQLRSATTIAIYTPIAEGRVTEGSSQVADTINRAIDLIGERNTTAALALLVQVENDPRSWNPIGVCYLMENNVVKAVEYLQRAANAGYSDAKANLEQIK